MLVAQLCLTLCNPMDCSLPGSSVDGSVSVSSAWPIKSTPMQELQETWVQSLGQEDPLEEEMAIHSSILAWRIPWTEGTSKLQSMGPQRLGHDWSHWAPTQQWSDQIRSVTQLCLTLCDPMDCSQSGSSVHGILQARILEWVAIP